MTNVCMKQIIIKVQTIYHNYNNDYNYKIDL